MNHNEKVLEEGKIKMDRIIYKHIYDTLVNVCDALLKDACDKKEYNGFTGNTQTSYSCGLYIDGVLSYYANQDRWNKTPIRLKVPKDEVVFLPDPYEGKPRKVKGIVEVNNMYGKDTAFSFISSYKAPKKGFVIVMCTGTEYSEYIEKKRGLNVLSDTYQETRKILFSKIKPIK